MASSDEGGLLFIGDHCELPGCKQVDFLPFVCSGCKATYCLTHRSAREHECPKAGAFL